MTNTIEKLIQSMMTTSTGINFMDSGGDDGRHWQKNQGKDFASLPAVTIDEEYLKDGDPIDYTVSTFHALVNSFELDDVCKSFNSRFAKMEDWDGTYGTSEKAVAWLKEKLDLVDDDFDKVMNTYNFETALSQGVQFTDLGDYALVQIHNGADARVGYTDAKLMKYREDYFDESIYGTITYPDGKEVYATGYGAYLKDEQGEDILYQKGMKFELDVL